MLASRCERRCEDSCRDKGYTRAEGRRGRRVLRDLTPVSP